MPAVSSLRLMHVVVQQYYFILPSSSQHAQSVVSQLQCRLCLLQGLLCSASNWQSSGIFEYFLLQSTPTLSTPPTVVHAVGSSLEVLNTSFFCSIASSATLQTSPQYIQSTVLQFRCYYPNSFIFLLPTLPSPRYSYFVILECGNSNSQQQLSLQFTQFMFPSKLMNLYFLLLHSAIQGASPAEKNLQLSISSTLLNYLEF